MNRLFAVMLSLVILLSAVAYSMNSAAKISTIAGATRSQETPTPTVTPSPSPSPSPTGTPTPVPEPYPTVTPTPVNYLR